MKVKKKTKITIEKGDLFVCIKTVKMIHSGEKVYRKGFTYVSEVEGCITNHSGEKHHHWDACKVFKQSFIYIKGPGGKKLIK